MEMQIIITYCVCDDVVKNLGILEDAQVTMNMAEVITTAITAAMFFGGNHERARVFMKEHNYIPNMLSKSQFNRRLLAVPREVLQSISYILAKVFIAQNKKNEFAVDSFPVPACDNIRIRRCKIFQEERYRGYIPSKRRYFYGLRVHMIQTLSGEPVEFLLAPGADSDITVFKNFDFNLPDEATIYADRAYTDYEFEDLLKEAASINLVSHRKKNAKRQHHPCIEYLRKLKRKAVETGFSDIVKLFPQRIHAVTANGFALF